MLLDQPLAGPAQLQPRAVDEQMHGLWPRPQPSGLLLDRGRGTLQRRGPAAQGGVVRHGEIEPEQAHEGADQALSLAQRQPEHGPERQGCSDRQSLYGAV